MRTQAPIHQRLQYQRILLESPHQKVTPTPPKTLLRRLQRRHGRQLPLRVLHVHDKIILREQGACLLQAQGSQEVLRHVLLEPEAADLLDHEPQQVDVHAVVVLLARVAHQEGVVEVPLVVLRHVGAAAAALFGAVRVHVVVVAEEVVGEAGGVRHEVQERDVLGGLAEDGLAGVVEAFEDLENGSGAGRVFGDRVVEGGDLALFEELQYAQRGAEFGEGPEEELRVCGVGGGGGVVGVEGAVGAVVDGFARLVEDEGADGGEAAGGDGGLEGAVERRGHGGDGAGEG